MPLLEVSDLYKVFSDNNKSFVAVDHVDLKLEAGECLGLIGESGCGKSTIASLIMHLISADSGKIIFHGQNLDSRKAVKNARSEMQMIFQNPVDSFDPRISLLEGVKQGLRFFSNPGKDELERRAKEAIHYVGLKDSYYDKKIHELSGGECQRAAIARAIISESRMIICDEATSALDVSVQAQVIELLRRLKEEKNISYLFITHDLLLSRFICDRIAVMYQGNIVEIGETKAVLDHPQHPYTRLLLSCALKPKADKDFKFITYQTLREAAKSGCKFYSNCPYARDKCRNQRPNLEGDMSHQNACFINSDSQL